MSLKAICKKITTSTLAVVLSLLTITAFAEGGAHENAPHDAPEKESFNAGEVILHHVQDVHELHLFIWHVPLPIILLDDGLKFFSSSSFYHNPQTVIVDGHEVEYHEHDGYILYHEDFYRADLGIDAIVRHDEGVHGVMDFSITKNVFGILLGLIIMFWVFLSAAKSYKTNGIAAPKGMAAIVEPIIIFVRDEVAKPAIGKKHEKYLPFLLTIFFFIWIGNLIGLLPFLGGINFTGNIAITMVLAAFVFFITQFSGNKNYWAHIFLPPGIPVALYPLMIPIEIAGVVIKAFVLMLRLFANITAGHIIILAFTCLIFILNVNIGEGAAWGASIAAVLFSVFMNFLELLVAFLQAYVFLLLAALYFGGAVEEAHH